MQDAARAGVPVEQTPRKLDAGPVQTSGGRRTFWKIKGLKEERGKKKQRQQMGARWRLMEIEETGVMRRMVDGRRAAVEKCSARQLSAAQ